MEPELNMSLQLFDNWFTISKSQYYDLSGDVVTEEERIDSFHIKDYEINLLFSFFGYPCTNKSLTIRPGTSIRKVNRVYFDFVLTLSRNYWTLCAIMSPIS